MKKLLLSMCIAWTASADTNEYRFYTITNEPTWPIYWSASLLGTNGKGVHFKTLDMKLARNSTVEHMMSNTTFESDWEPTVVKTNGRWRITFKP